MIIKVLDDRGIKYDVKYSKSPRISISVTKEALVKVRFHKSISEKKVLEYIEKNLSWIETNFIKNFIPERKYKTNERYLYLGKEFRLRVSECAKEDVFLDNGELVIYTKKLTYEHIDKLVNKFKKEQAEIIFSMILDKCFREMNNYLKKFPKLEIKKYKRRWGCCYPKEFRIVLNIALVHVPVYLIEYVVYHELCHFVYENHQKEFHNLLKKFVPNERKYYKELEQYRTNYE